MNRSIAAALLIVLSWPMRSLAGDAPSRFGVDAPELARLGSYAVGVRTLMLREAAQPDVLAFDPASGKAPLRIRELKVDLWYPALPAPGSAPAVYTGELPSEPPAPPAAFSVSGIAVREASPAGKGFPLVVVSHGYSNDPAAMIWLTENLASKGYVVAAIHHEDPPITDRSKFIGPLLRRPLDIAFVTRTLQRVLGSQALIDASRTALIGYSMGGYGVLTAAARRSTRPDRPPHMIPGGLLLPFVRGGPAARELLVPNLKAWWSRYRRPAAARSRPGVPKDCALDHGTGADHPGRSRSHRELRERRARRLRAGRPCPPVSPAPCSARATRSA